MTSRSACRRAILLRQLGAYLAAGWWIVGEWRREGAEGPLVYWEGRGAVPEPVFA